MGATVEMGTRVVFDCNMYLQALRSPHGPAGRCVQLAFDEKISLFISPSAIEELRDVVSRPKVIAKLQLVTERVEEFISAVESVATVIDGFPEVFRYERDPDDAHYVNLALAADAKLIVSRDKDLLDLMNLTKSEGAEFHRDYPELLIVDPMQFLRGMGE